MNKQTRNQSPESGDDLTAAYMIGYHKRDDEVRRLREALEKIEDDRTLEMNRHIAAEALSDEPKEERCNACTHFDDGYCWNNIHNGNPIELISFAGCDSFQPQEETGGECPGCGGDGTDGSDDGYVPDPCPDCHGTGRQREDEAIQAAQYWKGAYECLERGGDIAEYKQLFQPLGDLTKSHIWSSVESPVLPSARQREDDEAAFKKWMATPVAFRQHSSTWKAAIAHARLISNSEDENE